MLRGYATFSIVAVAVAGAGFFAALSQASGRSFAAAGIAVIMMFLMPALALNAVVSTVVLWMKDGSLHRPSIAIGLSLAFLIWLSIPIGNAIKARHQEQADQSSAELHLRFASMDDEEFTRRLAEVPGFEVDTRLRVLFERACLVSLTPVQEALAQAIFTTRSSESTLLAPGYALQDCPRPDGQARIVEALMKARPRQGGTAMDLQSIRKFWSESGLKVPAETARSEPQPR